MNHYFSEYIEALEHAGELVRITRRWIRYSRWQKLPQTGKYPHGGKRYSLKTRKQGFP
jgi:hypothetical protein